MNTALAVVGLAGALVALVLTGLKMAQRGGRKRGGLEKEKEVLQSSAEARARFDAAMARPLGKNARDAWARVIARRHGLPEEDSQAD